MASCNDGYLNQQCGATAVYGRHATINDAVTGMYLGWPETQFIGVIVAGLNSAAQDVAQLGLVINQPQE